MSNLPKFAATCDAEAEYMDHCGTGDTPEEAVLNFTEPGGPFDAWAEEEGLPPGREVSIDIYHVIRPEDSEWDQETIDDYGWTWCCGKLLRGEVATVRASADDECVPSVAAAAN